VAPTQGHDQGDRTDVHFSGCYVGPMDPRDPQDAAGWMKGGPEAGLLEELVLHSAPVVPDRRGDVHVLSRLLGDGTRPYDVADGSVRQLQNPGRRWPERLNQAPFPHHLRELTPRVTKEYQPCHSSASSRSPSRSTVSHR
jgi:hypothetical protein